MKVNNVSNVSFGKIYAVAGDKKEIAQIKNRTVEEQKTRRIMVMDATDIYKNAAGDGFCTRAVREGKQVAFFLTGKSIVDARFMSHGYTSANGISQHIDKPYMVKDVEKAVKYLKTQAAKDFTKDFNKKK